MSKEYYGVGIGQGLLESRIWFKRPVKLKVAKEGKKVYLKPKSSSVVPYSPSPSNGGCWFNKIVGRAVIYEDCLTFVSTSYDKAKKVLDMIKSNLNMDRVSSLQRKINRSKS